MTHPLLRVRVTAVIVSATVAIYSWTMTDLQGVNRVLTTLLAVTAAYLAFNAGVAYFERDS